MSADRPRLPWRRRLLRNIREQPLSYRVLLATLLWSLLITTLATVAQLVATYRNEVAQIARRLDDVEQGYLPSLEQSVWSVYTPQIHLVLGGILRLPDIAAVRLRASGLEPLVLGELPGDNLLIRRSYPIVHRGEPNIPLGTLEIFVSKVGVQQRLRDRAAGIAVSEAITIFLVALFVFVLLQVWVNRHLRSMARYARELDVSRLGVALQLERATKPGWPDEIDQVADAINRMRERLLRDIEARSLAEAELQRHRDHLEELVGERTAQLQSKSEQLKRQSLDLAQARDNAESAVVDLRAAQEQLVQSEKMASLGQLVAGVAHEVNTPLGIALTASSFLQEQSRALQRELAENRLSRSGLSRFAAETQASCALIERNLERAARLIHSFKQVSVDRTSDGRRRFELKAFLDELVESLRLSWKQRPIEVRVTCASDLAMDSFPGALGQVLTNLVQNAVLHGFSGDAGGLIEVAVETVAADAVLLRVRDNGVGVAAEHIGKIFEPFFTTRRGQGGSGLGLHIVFNLVTQKLGGQISVRSALGVGTCFELQLPMSAPVE